MSRAHLSSNLFFLYIFGRSVAQQRMLADCFTSKRSNFHCSLSLALANFCYHLLGKLVEEEEGSFALWLSYLVTGAGANVVSWLILPRSVVSVGASGAVFGLFAISVLVRVRTASWSRRKTVWCRSITVCFEWFCWGPTS